MTRALALALASLAFGSAAFSAPAIAGPTLEERFARRSFRAGERAVVVDARLDHLALRADPARDPDELAHLVEVAAIKVAAAAWPRVASAVRAREHGLFVVRFAEPLPRASLVAIARAVAPDVDAVYPALARGEGRAFADDRLVVSAAPGRLDQVLDKVLDVVEGRLVRAARVPDTAVVEVGAGFGRDAVEASRALAGIDGLVAAEPELYREYELTALPVDDPLHWQQWHLYRADESVPGEGQIFAHEAWQTTMGSHDVVVAVFDTGTDVGHEDLVENIVGGFDAVTGDDDPSAECGASFDGADYAASCPQAAPFRESHGTSVSGTIAARANNGIGVAGVCPSCGLMPVRLLGDGFGSSLSTAEAFVRAVDLGADVINNSWGPGASIFFPLSTAERDAFRYARTVGRDGRGTVILFAAGNDTTDVALDAYASSPETLAVSASTNVDDFALYSNYGARIDVAAPSHGGYFDVDDYGIVTTDFSGAEGYSASEYHTGFGGTSAASPVAAGVAGLILSANPELTSHQVRLVMTSTADKIVANQIDWVEEIGEDLETLFAYDAVGHSIGFGFGRVNAAAAVAAASAPSPLGALCSSDDCPVCDVDVAACLTLCSTQDDCPDGSSCDEFGRCRLPREDPLAIGAPCRADCPACVGAVDTQFEAESICTDVCDGDEGCPVGFDCRVPEAGGPALCIPGSRSAGEPQSFFNCRSDMLGVSLVVPGEEDAFCSDVCLADDGTCPFGFHCAPAQCECTASSNWGCWEYTCAEGSEATANFPATLCFADEGYGVSCTSDGECPLGDYCKGGDCVLDDRAGCAVCSTCTAHDDCGPLGFCSGLRGADQGVCTKMCAHERDCPGDSRCTEVEFGQGGSTLVCASPELPAEGFCLEGYTCAVACRDDVPCGDGLVCEAGACVFADGGGGGPPPPDVPGGPECACGATESDRGAGALALLCLLVIVSFGRRRSARTTRARAATRRPSLEA